MRMMLDLQTRSDGMSHVSSVQERPFVLVPESHGSPHLFFGFFVS